MTPQEMLNRNIQIEIGRLVLELATVKTLLEVEHDKAVSAETVQRGREDGAQGADGPRTGDS